ncbi:MAG: CoA pyrophosphatase [Atopobiaceae bacterium]|nr:CoA pyrophosphatase [Atopobiaceae bacterium]MCH4120459.1 CoA pyrophosphatase [Atopobiaceae bacterium]MCI1318860.1 CoA pyrophosphatase [Atopobiaceae bacterium]MCI1388297.1 CoA pyrophosphatase [Atopobiaceae bacterium]MCI1431453.1 CoA pyrophosphatase [Atopobiaceae bacterium]
MDATGSTGSARDAWGAAGADATMSAVAAGTACAGSQARLAVLVPVEDGPQGARVVLEVRSRELSSQPGEVSLPGGHVEPGETAAQAAVRETCEELLVGPESIGSLVALGDVEGPAGHPIAAFAARLSGYGGSFSPDEVERTFTADVGWLLSHEPETHRVRLAPDFDDDFPFDLVPGGRGYRWQWGSRAIPFWRGSDPMIWGATARVLMAFLDALRAGRAPREG